MKAHIKTENIVNEFAEAICHRDIETISRLLSDDFAADVLPWKDTKFNKSQFLDWVKNCLEKNEEEITYSFDQCSHCLLGAPVILFKPVRLFYRPPDVSFREMAGFAIESKGKLITGITSCTVFLKTENPFMFERVGREVIKLCKDTGLSIEEGAMIINEGLDLEEM